MTKIITRPAALVRQGKLKLFTTSFPLSDLLIPKFYSVERLDPEDPEGTGYQRLLSKARAKKLAEYLIEGQTENDAFLPTSLFLATKEDIDFDPATNTITFDIEKVGPFSVVDGQHRIEGLKLAADKRPEISSFEVPVNIAVNLPLIHQMCHFLIVNTTQKSVDQAVEQRIFARLTKQIGFEDVPNLPRWIRRIVDSGEDEQALAIVDYLNETKDSPWFGKIKMAMSDGKAANIKQESFVKSIKKYVLTANNPISIRPVEHQQKIFLNYWKAIANLLDAGKPTVLFKTIGADLFCRFSIPVFLTLENLGNFKVDTIERLLTKVFENVEGEYAGVGHADWWLTGSGQAGGLNAQALGRVNHDLTRALRKSESPGEIEV